MHTSKIPIAGWHSLPNEIRAEIFSYLDVSSVKALAQASPSDSANARWRLRLEDANWETRAALHPWLSQRAQSARDFVLQTPAPRLSEAAAVYAAKRSFATSITTSNKRNKHLWLSYAHI